VGGGGRKNGDFINPAMLESVIAQHPAIADVFEYGVEESHRVAGGKPLVAAVIPIQKEPSNQALTKTAFLAYCSVRLEKNDMPDIIQVLESIPKTVSEKPCIDLLNGH